MGEIKVSPDYNWFRSTVPLKKIIVDDDDSKIWSLYDAGPRSIRCPLIFLPPVSGTADVFFQQILALTGWGFRVIALQYPVYWDHLEFCDGFRKLLDHLQLDKVHLFGASLGGFLAQKFAEYTHKSPRVHSLILCNAFSDTSIFNQTWTANSFWLMPSFMLKKIVLGNFSSGPVDPMMADAIDFMVDRLESLGQSELASRLTLNCQNSYVEPHKIRDIPVTIMDVFDQSALSTEAKEEMYKLYPNARRAHLKTGGNFPYLCRSAEVNLYVQIHLLQFHGTKYAAIDPSMVSAEELEVQKGSLSISQEQQCTRLSSSHCLGSRTDCRVHRRQQLFRASVTAPCASFVASEPKELLTTPILRIVRFLLLWVFTTVLQCILISEAWDFVVCFLLSFPFLSFQLFMSLTVNAAHPDCVSERCRSFLAFLGRTRAAVSEASTLLLPLLQIN
uniref:maspardin isoform X1 n=2 Tax=Jaculus jaculus TaxID=51337 RepID=UPI001E1B53E6|nr:maspardin isoform X1 [Jaculus jaculus]XP_045017008.1 maspardin isoform X1 [Jaculus jaculus]